MTVVQIEYNAYLPSLKIFVNHRRLTEYSALNAYEHRPFLDFCDKLLDALHREINDEYELFYAGGDTDAEIVQALAENDPLCRHFERVAFALSMSPDTRLDDLDALGGQLERPATLFLAGEEDVLSAAFEILTESALFEAENDTTLVCRDLPAAELRICQTTPDALSQSNEEGLWVCLLTNAEDLTPLHAFDLTDHPLFVLQIQSHTGFAALDGRRLLFDVDADDLTRLFIEWLIDLEICPLLGKECRRLDEACQKGEGFLTEAEYARLQLLPLTRPYYQTSLPLFSFVGRSETITVKKYPAEAEKPYFLHSSDPRLMEAEGLTIRAKAEGVVQVYLTEGDDPDVLATATIRIGHANLINALALPTLCYKTTPGTSEKIALAYYPQDAVNEADIRWQTDDRTVATVDDAGLLHAVGCGKTTLTVSTPEASDRMEVIVLPRPEAIRLNTHYLELKVGESAPFTYTIKPEGALDGDRLRLSCSDSSVIAYNAGVITGKAPGNATLTVYTPDNRLSEVCRITVSRKKLF